MGKPMNNSLKSKRDQMAEEYSFTPGSNGINDAGEPPTYQKNEYDAFKAGFDAAVKLMSEELAARDAEIERLTMDNNDLKNTANNELSRVLADARRVIIESLKADRAKWRAMAEELGKALKALADRHRWNGMLGECICKQHELSDETLAKLEALQPERYCEHSGVKLDKKPTD